MPFRRKRVLLFTTLLLLSLLTSSLLRAQSTSTAGIEGLWRAEQRQGTPVAGVLTLDNRSGSWSAAIAGYKVSADLTGQHLAFALPGGLGSFRGHLDEARSELHGEWIQPGGVILDAQYATPLDLHPASAGVWQGQVVPLEQRISVYLRIEAKDGHLTAAARDPEANFLRHRIYSVTQNGSDILLEANGKKFRGTYDAQAGTLTVQVVDWLPAFRFTRRTTEDAAGFYPRVPSANKPWVYTEPVPLHDGWSVSTLKREGLDEAPIAKLIDKIVTADPLSTALDIQSLTIARHGHLVLEEYFYGFSADRVHDMRSAGKTFAPVLVGVARRQGLEIGPATRVYPLFAADAPFANPDERKRDVTLRDIMTMTAGNACDDNDNASPGNEDRMQSDAQQPDWYKYTLDLPMRTQPGGQEAVYCSGDLNLVGVPSQP